MGTIILRKIKNRLYTVYTHRYKRWRILIASKIEDKYWTYSKNKLKGSHPDYEAISIKINEVERNIRAAISALRLKGEEESVENVRILVQNMTQEHKLDPRKEKSFIYMFYKFLEDRTPFLDKKTYNQYYSMRNLLVKYQRNQKTILTTLNFKKDSFIWFLKFLIEKQNKNDATVHRDVKRMRTFLKWAYPNFDISFVKYKPPRDLNIIYLKEEELFILKNARLTGHLDKTRDLFLFLCTTGMRFSDSQRFKPEWVSDGVIEFRMQKTGGVAMPVLFSITRDILSKYGGYAPRMSNQPFNRFRKKLFRKLDLNRKVVIVNWIRGRANEDTKLLSEVVTSHVARKTFITLALSKGIALQDVMRMSGHADFKSIKPYMEISKEHLVKVARRWNL